MDGWKEELWEWDGRGGRYIRGKLMIRRREYFSEDNYLGMIGDV